VAYLDAAVGRGPLQDGGLDQPVKGRVEDHIVGTRDGVDDQRVASRVRVRDPHEGGQAADLDGGAVRVHGDRVVALRSRDGDRVRRAVRGRAAERLGQIDVDALEVGPARIVDRRIG
jgi:hypothetical protein